MRAGKTPKEAQLQLLFELCAEAGVPARQEALKKRRHDDFAEQVLKQVFNNLNRDTEHEQRSQREIRQWLRDEREEIMMLLQSMGRRKGKLVFESDKADG